MTPVELITAAQEQLGKAANDLASAQSEITLANALLTQALAALNPPAPTLYALMVSSGSGSGSYAAGTVVPVVATPPAAGKEFQSWTGPVTDPLGPTTTVVMPAAPVSVAATYKDIVIVPPDPNPIPGTRITQLTKLGQFNVPAVSGGDADGWPYANAVLAYCPQHNSLYIGGFEPAAKLGEISIPAFGATAVAIQKPVDPFGGKLGDINPGSPNEKRIGGVYLDGDTLVISAYDSYDGAGTQRKSHFRRPLLLSSAPSTVVGPVQVGPLNAAFYSGYMARLIPEWQAKFRGKALTGNSGIAITSNGSYGCSAAAFDPAAQTQSAIELVGYPDAHQTLGPWNKANQYYGGSDTMKGIVMPDGFVSVLFFGRHGTTFCYGGGSSQQPPPAGSCYDPTNEYKGTHGYPYNPSCWCYDANDLAAVAAGTKAPWDIKPYLLFTVPGMKPNAQIQGAAYDPATKRIYLSERNANGTLPVIHVYTAA